MPKPVDLPPYETVALVLQGGGALGSYQAGVYEGLHEAGIRPNWFAGISIGALNAAILAGNPPERRVERLREFWETICRPAYSNPLIDLGELANFWPSHTGARAAANVYSAFRTTMEGQAGFFTPRMPPPWLDPLPGVETASYYDTAPLHATLEKLVDFDLLNDGRVRVSVGAVDVATGNFAYFDNAAERRLTPEHFIASGALPPGFPAVNIAGAHYWDGGLVSNTPLAEVLEHTPRRDTLAFQVDLWSAHGEVPRSIPDVMERQKEIQYSSRTRAVTDAALATQKLRGAVAKLWESLPKAAQADPALAKLGELGCTKVYNVVHLIYESKAAEGHAKDYEFGPTTMREHWQAGLDDARKTLAHPEYLKRPTLEQGVVTHDVHRGR